MRGGEEGGRGGEEGRDNTKISRKRKDVVDRCSSLSYMVSALKLTLCLLPT